MEAYRTRAGRILEVTILDDDGRGRLTYEFKTREKIGPHENIVLLGVFKLIDPSYMIKKYIEEN